MSTILEKIADIENEMARTQKNKATAGHLGMLKAKLAKLRRELITPKSQGGGTQEGFEVAKTGDARIGFIGFPSVGKSTLLSNLAGVYSEVIFGFHCSKGSNRIFVTLDEVLNKKVFLSILGKSKSSKADFTNKKKYFRWLHTSLPR